ncbi:unnamed protein product [Blepharisma stoltei]|uniref:Uncharacterized protein n=1 Tax=Blepharisma stoltei TaxID=1481888 RepID=A0AAU9JI77_9CILI|nr:unnamed protein product [Blepharisma stoltei]
MSELSSEDKNKDSFTKANQYYLSQINQMEIKISELKAHLSAKDSEISYLNDRISLIENNESLGNRSENLEKSTELSEVEPKIIGSFSSIRNANEDITSIKLQLDHAISVKKEYEEKYRKALSSRFANKNPKELEEELYSLIEENLKLMKSNEKLKLELETEKLNSELKRKVLEDTIIEKNEFISHINDQYEKSITQLHKEIKALKEKPKITNSHLSSMLSTPREEAKVQSFSPLNSTKFGYLDSSSLVSTEFNTDCTQTPVKSITPLGNASISSESLRGRSYSAKNDKNKQKIARLSEEPCKKLRLKFLNEALTVKQGHHVDYCPSFLRTKKFSGANNLESSVKIGNLGLSNSFYVNFSKR